MIVNEQNFTFLKLVKHQGNFFSIAAKVKTQELKNKDGKPSRTAEFLEIYYNLLDPTKNYESGELPVGDELWTTYQKLTFPTEYIYAGSSLIKFKIEGIDEEYKPNTTSINTINAPFQVLSDGLHIYIFRATVPLIEESEDDEGNKTNNVIKPSQVYVDRFAFDNATKQLNNKKEVRYVRSQNKDIPLNNEDTFGAENLNDEEFIEPTTQLNFEKGVVDSNFTVAILPNAEFASQENWHFFVLEEEKEGSKIKAYSIPRSFDGLFDLPKENLVAADKSFNNNISPYDFFHLGKPDNKLKNLKLPSSLLYNYQEQIDDTYKNRQQVKRGARYMLSLVSPNEKKEGRIAFIDFEVGRNGIPSTVSSGESKNNTIGITSINSDLGISLEFNGKSSKIISKNDIANIPFQSTFALWVKVFKQDTPTTQTIVRFTVLPTIKTDLAHRESRVLSLNKSGELQMGKITLDKSLAKGVWNHIAVTSGSSSYSSIIYVNGEVASPVFASESSKSPDFKLVVGQSLSGDEHFFGQMSDLRIWSGSMDGETIKKTMHDAENQKTDNLIVHWEMSEGAGTQQASGDTEGLIVGARWVDENIRSSLGMGLEFNGKDSKIISKSDIANIPSKFTFAFWIKVFEQDSPTIQPIIGFTIKSDRDNSRGGIPRSLYLNTSGKLQMGLATSDKSLIRGVWNHIAVTATHQTTIYVNGDASSPTSDLQSNKSTDFKLVVGQNTSGDEHFFGQMSDLRIWSGSMDGETIKKTMHNAGNQKTDNLIVHWEMSEGAGTQQASGDTEGLIVGARWVAANAPNIVNMPIVHSDKRSLNIRTNFLDFITTNQVNNVEGNSTSSKKITANTNAPVDLLESADGKIHCFFNQIEDDGTARFYVIEGDIATGRSIYKSSWTAINPDNIEKNEKGSVLFTSVTCSTDTNNATITIEDNDNIDEDIADNEAFCKITFKLPDSSKIYPNKEVWTKVPRDISILNQVINGQAIDPKYVVSDDIAKGENDDRVKEVSVVLEKHETVVYDYQNNVKIGNDEKLVVLENPEKSYVSHLFQVGLADTPNNGETGNIRNTDPSENPIFLVVPALNNRWLKTPVLASIHLNQSPLRSQELALLPLENDFTIETWVRPLVSGFIDDAEQTIIQYSSEENLAFQLGIDENKNLFAKRAGFLGSSKAVLQATKQPIPNAEWTHLAASYQSGSAVNLKHKAFIETEYSEDFNLNETFTLEGWVNMKSIENENIIQRWNESKNEESWKLYGQSYDEDKASNALHFSCRFNDGDMQTFKSKMHPETSKQWNHFAVVFDSSQREIPCIRNRGKDSDFKLSSKALDQPFSTFTIEMWLNMSGKKSDDKDAKFLTRVIGDSKMFFAYSQKEDYTGATPKDLTFQVSVLDHVFSLDIDNKNNSDHFNVPNDFLSHISVVYYGNEDGDKPTDDSKTATIIVYQDGVEIKKATDFTGIIPKADNANQWQLGSDRAGSDTKDFFQGLMGEVRFWEIARTQQQLVDFMNQSLGGNEPGLAGLYTFKALAATGKSDFGILLNAVDNSRTDVGKKVAPEPFNIGQRFRLYVNGELDKSCSGINSSLMESSANLWFGKESTNLCLDDIKLWKSPRTLGQLQYYMKYPIENVNNQFGLVAYWPFDEGKGRLITDVKASHEGIIKGGHYKETPEEIEGLWIPSPFNAGFTFYINGEQVASEGDKTLEDWTKPTTNLNKLLVGDGYFGRMNELRVWDHQRDLPQIKGSIFNSLGGEEEGLVTYYRFSTGSGDLLVDSSQNDYDLDGAESNFNWKWPLSESINGRLPEPMVPINENYPVITAISNGLYTQQGLDTKLVKDSTPASLEIGTNRTLAYLTQGETEETTEVNLKTDFNVGDVELLYVGQVQFDPTLIGYIEGAPPVPSENLSVDMGSNPNKYVGASSTQLSESNNVTHVFSGSKEKGFDMSTDIKLASGFATRKKAVIAPLGFGIEADTIKSTFLIGLRTKIDHSLGWINDTSVSDSLTVSNVNQLDMSGAWVNNRYNISKSKPENLYQQADRLYIPNNMGHALVKSRTADLFAVRLKKTGANLGFRMIPNPDIPEDMNIIMFKIKPTYIKNGTLDGHIGFDIDNDYKNIITSPEQKGSFFKPQEAFALKRKIEREQQELENYFNQFDSSSKGRNANSDFSKIDNNELSRDEWLKKMARQNLVNTYVWTSDGGLFAEEEQFAASRSEVIGGSYKFSQMGGVFGKTETEIGFIVNSALSFEAEALFGGHINTKITKSKTDDVGFSIKSVVSPEDFLNKIAKPLLPERPLLVAGDTVFQTAIDNLNLGKISAGLRKALEDEGIELSKDTLSKTLYKDLQWKLISENETYDIATSDVKNTFTLTQVNKGLFPVDFEANSLPGKVKGYRFMSFYLAPNKDNFNNFQGIIDEDWLKSSDPDAVALAQALGNTNEVWRMFHRVTYVNRVVPEEGDFESKEDVAIRTIEHPDNDSKVSNVSIVKEFCKDSENLITFSNTMDSVLDELEENEDGFGKLDKTYAKNTLMRYAEALQVKDDELTTDDNK